MPFKCFICFYWEIYIHLRPFTFVTHWVKKKNHWNTFPYRKKWIQRDELIKKGKPKMKTKNCTIERYIFSEYYSLTKNKKKIVKFFCSSLYFHTIPPKYHNTICIDTSIECNECISLYYIYVCKFLNRIFCIEDTRSTRWHNPVTKNNKRIVSIECKKTPTTREE